MLDRPFSQLGKSAEPGSLFLPGTWSASMSLPRTEQDFLGHPRLGTDFRCADERTVPKRPFVSGAISRRDVRTGKVRINWVETSRYTLPENMFTSTMIYVQLRTSIEIWNISPREAALVNGSFPANLCLAMLSKLFRGYSQQSSDASMPPVMPRCFATRCRPIPGLSLGSPTQRGGWKMKRMPGWKPSAICATKLSLSSRLALFFLKEYITYKVIL